MKNYLPDFVKKQFKVSLDDLPEVEKQFKVSLDDLPEVENRVVQE